MKSCLCDACGVNVHDARECMYCSRSVCTKCISQWADDDLAICQECGYRELRYWTARDLAEYDINHESQPR